MATEGGEKEKSGFSLFCFDSAEKKTGESSCFPGASEMLCQDGATDAGDASKRLKLKHGAIMKILVVGDKGVGKSAVANSFVNIQRKLPPSTQRKSDGGKAAVPKVDFLHANVERQGYKLHVIFHDFAGSDAHPDEVRGAGALGRRARGTWHGRGRNCWVLAVSVLTRAR